MPVLKTDIERRSEMQKYKYKYQVDEPKFDEWAFNIETDWDSNCLEYVAEAAADDFHSNHDGWEAHWPCDFYIFDLDGKLLGIFTVQREAEPVFSATEKKNAPQDTNVQNGHIAQQATSENAGG
jgi:hypothetical protein